MEYQRLFESGISTAAAQAWRAQGKKALGVICCHVPEELFYAADILPVRMRATDCVDNAEAQAWMSSFSCSFARGILQYWLAGPYKDLDGIVTSDGCMQASRVYDNAAHINARERTGKYIRQIDVPRKTSKRAYPFYKEELQILISELEKLSGSKVTDEKLKEAAAKFNEARKLIARIYALRKEKHPVISGADCLRLTLSATNMPIDEYVALLKAFLADARNRTPITDYRARLMVIGSGLDDPQYLQLVESKGALVVQDALCFGARGFNEPLEIDDGDVLGSIARYYLDRLVCPRMMDKHFEMDDYIIDACKQWQVDGILYQRMQYCEIWGGEAVYFQDRLKDAGIPMLTVEREEQLANAGQLGIRVEAFVEMVEKED
ncbi:MAG: 2-hydroxyacyl-CoA dehydratase family protein [Oscillospiraceae bacterium]|jgi:benzoyl-CoA reductase/2-hydroxyglutaryl-CoA dehydratase subunit BcrC/BadD/HgdB|nr:2-hydroxyacyl-CoA dehydratase family protein [Oscillospiraceae bacterium]